MIEATEYFAGLFADNFQPVLVFDGEKNLCYRNPAADGLFKLWAEPAPTVFLTPAIQREMEFCLDEIRGVSLSEKICDWVLPLQILPIPHKDRLYLVLQVCYRLSDKKQEDVLHILRHSHSKLASYMNRIYGVAQSLGMDSPAGKELARNTRRILRMSNHLYSCLDEEPRYRYRLPLNISSFLTGFIRSAEEVDPTIRIYTAPCLADLYARVMPEDLELVMGALLSNAIRFGGGEVQIIALQEGDRICIEFRDNGPGVENPRRLFEAGYRTPDRKGALGLGFSLNIARQLMSLQGAELEYERVDDHSCFRILLQAESEQISRMAEWDFESENSLSQLRIELSDI